MVDGTIAGLNKTGMTYQYIDLGQWGPPYRDEIEGNPIARYKNEADEDWYAAWAHNPNAPSGFVIFLDADGVVQTICNHVDQSEPGNKRGLILPDFPTDPQARRAVLGKFFDFTNGIFVDPPPKAPPFVTRSQALMALHNAGLLEQVETLIAGHEYLPVRLWFNNALRFERNHAYLQAIAIELELTEQQVDDLFIAASMLTQ